jgi:hypothetical protein
MDIAPFERAYVRKVIELAVGLFPSGKDDDPVNHSHLAEAAFGGAKSTAVRKWRRIRQGEQRINLDEARQLALAVHERFPDLVYHTEMEFLKKTDPSPYCGFDLAKKKDVA